jgi:hypothetical protein
LQLEQIDKNELLYENPLFHTAITFLEPFPLELVNHVDLRGSLEGKAATTTFTTAPARIAAKQRKRGRWFFNYARRRRSRRVPSSPQITGKIGTAAA